MTSTPRIRLAMVTRRYWPLQGGAERAMSYLAEALTERNVSPTIVTAQWEPHWPPETDQLAVPVVRLPRPQVRGWGTLRYLWSLSRWLRQHRGEFDAVLVSSLKEEAFTTLVTLGSAWGRDPLPIILRAERSGPQGDCHWQQTAHFGSRIRQRCQTANAIIAPDESVSEELLAAGYDANRLVQIPHGVPISTPRTAETRLAARASLAEIHDDLSTAASTPVALFVGDLRKEKGLHDLVRAWRKIVEIWPDARLWLIGEGPERSDLYHRIRDSNLQYHVFMPGAFDDVSEFLHAADLFVAPAHEEGTCLAMLEALAVELPVIATNLPSHERLLKTNQNGWVIPKRNSIELAEALARVFSIPQAAAARAALGRSLVMEKYSIAHTAEQYRELFARLAHREL